MMVANTREKSKHFYVVSVTLIVKSFQCARAERKAFKEGLTIKQEPYVGFTNAVRPF